MTWCVGLVTHNKEFMCSMDMIRLGIESYIPIGTKLTKPKQKHKPVRTIFFPFPGYIFVKNVREQYSSMQRVRGFKQALFDIQEEQILRVRTSQTNGEFDFDLNKKTEFHFKYGEQVRITNGPLTGAYGIVNQHNYGNRWAIIDVSGMKVKILVDFIKKLDIRVGHSSGDPSALSCYERAEA